MTLCINFKVSASSMLFGLSSILTPDISAASKKDVSLFALSNSFWLTFCYL